MLGTRLAVLSGAADGDSCYAVHIQSRADAATNQTDARVTEDARIMRYALTTIAVW